MLALVVAALDAAAVDLVSQPPVLDVAAPLPRRPLLERGGIVDRRAGFEYKRHADY